MAALSRVFHSMPKSLHSDTLVAHFKTALSSTSSTLESTNDNLNTFLLSAQQQTATATEKLSGNINGLANTVLEKASSAIAAADYYSKLTAAGYRTIYAPDKTRILPFPEYAPLPTPEHWEQEKFQAGGRDITFYRSNVEDPIDTIICALGHNTKASYYKPWVERMNSKGLNVVILELPKPENNTHFKDGVRIDDGYEAIIGDALLNPKSAVFKGVNDEHLIHLALHSSSAQGFERSIFKSDKKAAFASFRFGKIFEAGLMLDTANSSRLHDPIEAYIYHKLYSVHPSVANNQLGSTEVDQFFIKEGLEGDLEEYMYEIEQNPTHGQAHCLAHGGYELYKNTEDSSKLGRHFNALPRTILMGENESSACPHTVEQYANNVSGATMHSLKKGTHNPYMNCAEAYRRVARAILPASKVNAEEIDSIYAAASASPATRALQAA